MTLDLTKLSHVFTVTRLTSRSVHHAPAPASSVVRRPFSCWDGIERRLRWAHIENPRALFKERFHSLTFQELSEARIRVVSRSWRITIFCFRTSSLCRASWGPKFKRIRLTRRRREQMDGEAEGRDHMSLTLRYSESWMIS